MPALTITSKYKIGYLPMSPASLISEYLHGIPLTDQNGLSYPIREIRKKILKATKQMENFLKIKIVEQTVNEVQDYIQGEWAQWGHIKCEYVVNKLEEIKGFLNSQQVTDFPVDMWVSKGRNIALVPGAYNLSTMIWFGNAGVFPILRGGVDMVPNFWHLSYKTGFVVLPEDVLSVIGKVATIQILAILGDILLGAGIASTSLSFDGLSESIGTTQSAENSAYSARIRQYAGELKYEILRLKSYYRGITFETV